MASKNRNNFGVDFVLLVLAIQFLPLIGLYLMTKEDKRELGAVLFIIGILIYIFAYR